MTNPSDDPYPRCWVASKPYNPALAALLSLILPGAGQMYRGSILKGMFWLPAISFCYLSFDFLNPLGVVLHLWCMLSAALGTERN